MSTLCGTGGVATLPDGGAGNTETTIFDSSQNGGSIAGYHVKNLSDTDDIKIRVGGMHLDETADGGTDGMAVLGPGEELLFAWEGNCIDKVSGYGDGADVQIRCFVQSRR
jgi:hypothetical protein